MSSIVDDLRKVIITVNTPCIIRLHKMINDEYERRKEGDAGFRQKKWNVLNAEMLKELRKKRVSKKPDELKK
jgi:hypothetical protein